MAMSSTGFLGNFLSKGLKTNQLEVNTDEKTLRPIARLKEPRDLFALPKDKDHDCSQQAPRWPIECQVIEERIVHIPYVPAQPEPYNQPSGHELKPRPVGEENGVIVFNYNPVSAVNYKKKSKAQNSSSDSDISSSESRGSSPDRSTPDRRKLKLKNSFTKLLASMERRSSSNSYDEYDEDDDENDNDDADDDNDEENEVKDIAKTLTNVIEEKADDDDIDDIWASKSPEYQPATPTYIKSQFGKDLTAIKGKARFPEDVPLPSIPTRPIAPVKLTESKPNALSKPPGDLGSQITKTSDSSSGSSSSSSLSSDIDIEANFNEGQDDDDDDGSKTLRETVTATNMNSQQAAVKTKEQNSKSLNKQLAEILAHNQVFKPNSNTSSSNGSQLQSVDLNVNYDFRSKNTIHTENQYNSYVPNRDNELVYSDSLYDIQFSRSAVGGSKILMNCHPCSAEEYDGLEFESRFESGNLAKAVMITQTYYELHLRSDLYTSRSKQWFYFRVRRTRKNVIYRFSIVNLVKSDSLYNDGMRPLMYSTISAKQINEGWRRCGTNIAYYRNDDDTPSEEEDENSSYTLTFNIEFKHDNDTVYFAHSYPYTYSDLQDYLMTIQKDPVKSKFCKLRLLCRSLAGNNVYYLTVTAPVADEEAMRKKKAIVVSARVHPSETPASWMMKGLMDFITGDTLAAKRLRHRFIFKLIPMLNPDGVIVGNTRNSLTGKDLNRQYRTVIRETYPSIWYTKAMVKRLIDEYKVVLYCDMHAHSRKHNIFVYGCENKRNPEKKLTEQVFPLMLHKNVADKFSFESCKFKVQRSKEGTGRIVVWMLGITNSYTIEASFGGSSLGSRKGTHFHTADYEHMGKAFCETLLDYGDDTPNKVKRMTRHMKQIKRIRKREKREKKALKLKKMAEQERLRLKIIERLLKEGSNADEPLNIPLSDYSSDEGGISSSENECRGSSFSDLEGPCCALSRAPPSTPEAEAQHRRHKLTRMRRVMRELDRIYFQPLFQRKFRCFIKVKRGKSKRADKKNSKRKSTNSFEIATNSQIRRLQGGAETGDGVNRKSCIYEDIFQDAHDGTSNENLSITSPGCDSVTNESDERAFLSAEGEDSKQDCRKMAQKPQTSKKKIKETPLVQRPTVSRKLRTWLAERKIFILRRKQKQRKARPRRSHSNRKRSETRIALDLPTTDPSADLIFSTDDEANPRDEDGNLPQYCVAPRERTRRLLQSELQRRYIEEIGDNGTERGRAKMPPELIITSPSKGTKITIRPSMAPTQRLPDAIGTLEFPVAFKPARRTNSWHNLNNGALKPVCMARQNSRMNNPYTANENNIEELDLKLSLKKKYWTGVKPEKIKDVPEYQRPLSWNQPIIRRPHQLKKPSREKLDNQSFQKADSEAFLNACSQKLMHWQQELNNVGKSCVENGGDASPMLTRKIDIQLDAIALGMPELIDDERTLRIFRKVAQTKKELKAPTKEEVVNVEHKHRRRSNALSKIADTTQLITRLTKSKSKTRSNHNQSTANRNSNISIQQQGATLTQVTKAGVQGINRFKTGGIVVTAVQQSSTKKVKKHHRNNKSQHSLVVTGAGGASKKEQNNSTGGTLLSKTNLSMKASVSSSTFARKVKTKLAKKKSHHSRDEPSIIIPSNRNLVNTNGIIVANNSIFNMPLSRKT
ncbi:cytosolic carboxypeptidase Nna1 isoform X3 [Bactrocera dorsalis]|uniref:Cytosolic carboxypeptidase Nna1 isoform X3 n=1 Tax=Bactrocera dorsalis TaxID=27457 RepID=A0ABM3JSQ5_BACDO|nr:cytosolic carboxypeptidase Nna1 isoform X3 [Bactrocera dorsalis]